jgi:UDP-glucuronate decarboxylase
MNLGNSTEFTILELAEKVIHMTDSKSKIAWRSLPQDDPRQRKPDITLAEKSIGWKPKTDLELGLKETINFFKQNIHSL